MEEFEFVKNLYVKIEDDDFKNVSLDFLQDIEKKFTKFKKLYKKNYSKLEKYQNSNNFIFEPEGLSKKSPLTLINASWGAGKTFFIESFIKLFIDNKIQSNIFKRILIIDAWKFSNSKDIPLEFAIELADRIIKSQIKNANKNLTLSLTQKILNIITPTILTWQVGIPGIASLSGTHNILNNIIEKNNDEKDTKEEKVAWNNIKNNKIPTIIFIDNLERLGSLSWDLLKAILKIQEFENYLIILPLNLNKLKKQNPKIDNSEYPIEKYIDFHYYNFIQDYSNFFKKNFKERNYLIDNLNSIFNTEINNHKLSIRAVERACKSYNLFEIKDDYEVLKIVQSKIWKSNDVFKIILKEDIKKILFNKREELKLHLLIGDKLLEKNNKNEYINISNDDEIKNIIFTPEYYSEYPEYIIDFDYLSEYLNWETKIQKRKASLSLIIINNNKKIILNETKIQKYNKKIEKLSKEQSTLKIQVEKEENKKLNYKTLKHSKLENALNFNYQKINELKKDIEDFKNDINELLKSKTSMEDMKNKLFLNIRESINEIKKIEAQNTISPKLKEDIIPILKSHISNIYEILEEDYNFDLKANEISELMC